ncbi:hypothetical protein DM01DRAFT_1207100 [Hesseltinella vesiculosa]|uniref:Uncharacterized protein n=1 Tax=Hesseltinella vesiculosa TaxID=101127 RepID=A0A1X2GPX7_9FUNG|nr:hypothetical protein DM01DRAFT_1207100 [Hesseltinella vesiculosa]
MLEPNVTKEILERLPDWNRAITPSGKVAKEPCFVQQRMPLITLLRQDHTSARLVTHSAWTHQLVDNGILWDTSNDITMRSLAMTQLLFYPQQHTADPVDHAAKCFHAFLFKTCAWMPVNQILRPTLKFQRALEHALTPPNQDPRHALQKLIIVFHVFGFLWPQRVILGRRMHLKKPYRVRSRRDRLLQLRIAMDKVYQKFQQEKAEFKKPSSLQGTDEE